MQWGNNYWLAENLIFLQIVEEFCPLLTRNGIVLLSNTINPTLTSTRLERGMRIPSATNTTLSIRSVYQLGIHNVWKMCRWQIAFAVQVFNGHKQVCKKCQNFVISMKTILLTKLFLQATSNDNSSEETQQFANTLNVDEKQISDNRTEPIIIQVFLWLWQP